MLVKGTLPLPKEIRKILVIQLGDIGDVVATIPSLKAIKSHYPEAGLFLLLREPNGEILEEETYIEKIFYVQKRPREGLKNFYRDLSLILALRRARFDFVIDLRASDRGAYLAFLTGAPIRAAAHYKSLSWRDRFFTHLVPERSWEPSRRGPVYQSLEVLRPLGIETDEVLPCLQVSPEALTKVSLYLDKQGISCQRRLVTINPFSRWRYKEWPTERWAQVAKELAVKWDMTPILIGSPADEGRARQIEGLGPGRLLNLVGKTSLKELAALLKLAFLHVGIDSAATHIAAAVGTPTITIFGPTDWQDWAPKGELHRVVHDERPCVPCRKKGCEDGEESLCLKELPAGTVLREIERHITYLESR